MDLALVLFGSFFILIMLGVPIAVSLGVSSVVGLWWTGMSYSILAPTVYSAISKYSLLAIPFFILAGFIMEKAGISRRLIYCVETLLGGLRGGLALSAVVAAVFFAAISGSGPATVAALGAVLIPAMVAQGYDRGMAGGLLASSGSIGIIIPPSVAFIVFASLAQVSVAELFVAGVVPGLLVAAGFIACTYIVMGVKGNFIVGERHSYREKLVAFRDALWGILTPVIILGGIYSGIFTPTEAAGVAVVYGLFVGVVVYREISPRKLLDVLVDAAVSTASVMYIVALATVFAYLLTTTRVAQDLAQSIVGISSSAIVVLLVINAVLLVAGFFLDTISAYFIFLPVILPIALELGVDPIHLGVFVTVNLAIGQFTPPVGVNLFVASNIGKIPANEIMRSVVPYILSAIISLLVITFIPQLSTWLPSVLVD
ncbi:TRAP transporter large permease [Aeromicrobium sp. CTD01-1L150]|uniref:TRAP transporter large permease n=1 Tax=Aeromicrobium sp. CTD01-1L150 TaxID=3341830 RepID=UPI0035C02E53